MMVNYITIIFVFVALFLAYRVYYPKDNFVDSNMIIPSNILRVGQERHVRGAGHLPRPLDPNEADDHLLSQSELKIYGYNTK